MYVNSGEIAIFHRVLSPLNRDNYSIQSREDLVQSLGADKAWTCQEDEGAGKLLTAVSSLVCGKLNMQWTQSGACPCGYRRSVKSLAKMKSWYQNSCTILSCNLRILQSFLLPLSYKVFSKCFILYSDRWKNRREGPGWNQSLVYLLQLSFWSLETWDMCFYHISNLYWRHCIIGRKTQLVYHHSDQLYRSCRLFQCLPWPSSTNTLRLKISPCLSWTRLNIFHNLQHMADPQQLSTGIS